MATIYRFKFSEEFLPILVEFSTIHQYDKPKDFKEAFEEWKEENRSLIAKETIRLENIGYEGNVFNKMYKSDFKTKYIDSFENECLQIGEFLDKQQTLNKIKKTYKNRYFLLTKH